MRENMSRPRLSVPSRWDPEGAWPYSVDRPFGSYGVKRTGWLSTTCVTAGTRTTSAAVTEMITTRMNPIKVRGFARRMRNKPRRNSRRAVARVFDRFEERGPADSFVAIYRHSTRGSRIPYRMSEMRFDMTTTIANTITTAIVPLKLYPVIASNAYAPIPGHCKIFSITTVPDRTTPAV